MNLSFKNGSPPVSIRVAGFNETIIKTAPSASGASDQEIFINPPDNIKSIKEIS
jgi:hypothetical protein